MTKIKLLFIEDDSSFAFIVKECLELTGRYEVCSAPNGKAGLEAYISFTPDIIVSDIEMPVMNGLQMVKEIRKKDSQTPILFATGRTKAQDVLDGYELNVDNFIKKPYIPDELDAHIQAILKRMKKQIIIVGDKNVHIGEYRFDVSARTLQRENEIKNLTPKEANILWKLYQNKNEIVKREDFLMDFWGINDFYTSRSLDVFINTLRKYLDSDPQIKIETVRGAGLKLIVP